MSYQTPRSLLTQCITEPLPPYTPRHASGGDPETSSILSSAPSYRSAAPSYHSTLSPGETSVSISCQRRAPGSQRLETPRSNGNRNASISNPSALYNISEWVPVTGGIQARHYHNVARRRATEASMALNLSRSVFPLLNLPSLETGPGIGASPSLYALVSSGLTNHHTPLPVDNGNRTDAYPRSALTARNGELASGYGSSRPDDLPLSPYEDSDLVGEAAAARFRSQRLYRTYQQQENQQIRSELTGHNPLSHQLSRPGRFAPLVPPPGQEARSVSTPLSSSERCSSQSVTSISGQPGSQEEPSVQPLHQHAATSSTAVDEALQQESKTWDFMISQMADWQERERSWNKFKEEMDRRMAGGMFKSLRLGISLRKSTSESGQSASDSTTTTISDGGSGRKLKKKNKNKKDERGAATGEGKSSKWKRKFSLPRG